MTVDVYQQYFAASCTWNGVERHAASVRLTAESGEGKIAYLAEVSFFPHQTEDDFAVSYDAYAERTLYAANGRRSKKREAVLLETLQPVFDEIAASLGGVIDWTHPLREARRG